MSYQELQAHIWSQLSLRKRLAGRAACDRILRRAVRVLPTGMMSRANEPEQDHLMQHVAADIVRNEQHNSVTVGSILLTIILSALVSEIVKLLLAWWRARSDNQLLLRDYQLEMRDNG